MESFIKYFVSFSHFTDGAIGFGNHEVFCEQPIKNMDGVKQVAKRLEEITGAENIVILHYREF